MLILVVYDIRCSTSEGKRRLHKVSKYCESLGKRVQNSVFECLLDASQFRQFKSSIASMIDPEWDLLRFYNLGNTYENRIDSVGNSSQDYYENPIIL